MANLMEISRELLKL